jgi:hypothetical protein
VICIQILGEDKMKKYSVLGQLFLLSVILVACSTSEVGIDVPDDVVTNVERAFSPKWYALYVMKGATPQTEADVAGRNWIICSHYDDAFNNMMWLAQNTNSLQITTSNLIGAPTAHEEKMLSDCQSALDTKPESILVIDRDIKFETLREMVELKLK